MTSERRREILNRSVDVDPTEYLSALVAEDSEARLRRGKTQQMIDIEQQAADEGTPKQPPEGLNVDVHVDVVICNLPDDAKTPVVCELACRGLIQSLAKVFPRKSINEIGHLLDTALPIAVVEEMRHSRDARLAQLKARVDTLSDEQVCKLWEAIQRIT